MSIAQEKHLIQSLSPFYVMAHLFYKYSKSYPRPEFITDLFGDHYTESEGSLVISHPFDQRIRRIYVRTSDVHSDAIKEITVNFSEKVFSLPECIEFFGPHSLEFDAEKMISYFDFERFRSIFIDRVRFKLKGKYTRNEDGSFQYIDPIHFERQQLNPDDVMFRSFNFVFRQFEY